MLFSSCKRPSSKACQQCFEMLFNWQRCDNASAIMAHVANGLSSIRSFTHCFTVLSVCFLHRTLRMVGSL
jgi:hypothetical protein